MLRIRRDDTVVIIAGKDKGKKGKVLKVFTQDGRILVEQINLMKKHMRKTRDDQKGGIVEKEAPLHISNVMLVCRNCNRPTRVGVDTKGETRARICKKCGVVT